MKMSVAILVIPPFWKALISKVQLSLKKQKNQQKGENWLNFYSARTVGICDRC